MNKSFSQFLVVVFLAFCGTSYAQVYSGESANKLVNGASMLKVNEETGAIEFVRFRDDATLSPGSFNSWAKKVLKLGANEELREISMFQDNHGGHHRKYQQYYKGVPVFGATYTAHIENDRIVSVSGKIAKGISGSGQAGLSETSALNAALNKVGAETYKWQIPGEERHLKEEQESEGASYYPKGKLVYIIPSMNFDDTGFRLAYQFDIYAHKPLYRADVFVDAQTGEVLFENNHIHIVDAVGSAVTGYSGTRTITTDFTGSTYRLRETGRGGGVRTYDMNEGTNYGNAVDFTDSDNNWNNVNANLDQYATDAHWGAEMTYDYFLNFHNRNSIDDNGMMLRSYIHYDNGYNNAFWDGSRMTYGDGNNAPLTSLDVCGHELTHGVTEYTAGLVYQDESGALNESFSDIFGTAVEFFARPNDADWLMAGDLGAFRSMSNPNAYGDPDTYFGTNWYTGTGDNGGVHINSGVQNKWFYILTVGETGTNDLGDQYNVTGIGMTSAAEIAYRNLSVYLSNSSEYDDARFYAIQSAIDLFGPCSPEVIATANAWYAVGVGDEFDPTVTSDFSTVLTSSCQVPFTAQFTNLSNNGGSFIWDFGDGSTSSATNPSHTYTTFGNYTVSLVSDGGACGTETEVKNSYISVNGNNPCVSFLPTSGSGTTQTSCIGTLYDNGGPASNYTDNGDVRITIAPTGASTVTLTFTSFAFEEDYDYLYVYDGPTTGSPLIGQYTGNNLPNGGSITSTGSSLTIRQVSDPAVTESGFEANWVCTALNSAPSPNFTGDPVISCSGEINFTDLSVNGPTSWQWDFGDGNSSSQQNPSHTYQNEGTYTVALTVANSFGNSQTIRNNYVVVDKPDGPNASDALRCGAGTFDLSASGSGTLNWYDAAMGGTLLYTGSNFTTPNLSAITSYYVEEVTNPSPQNVGPANNTFGTGGNFEGDQHLIFDCSSGFKLVSVKVYASGTGNRTIQLRNSSGGVLRSLTTNVPNGESRITLNWDIQPGSNYQLGTTTAPNLYRNNEGPSYPYTIPGVVSIETSSAGDDYYYFFYDWEIQEPSCISERTEVLAEIVAEPAVTDGSRCGTGTVDLSASGSGNLVWFDASTNGNQVGSGTSFTTPSISSTTTYYVESQVPAPSLYGGAVNNNFGTGGYFNGTQSLLFDALSDFTLVSVKVYASGAGNRTFELRDGGGGVLQSTTVNVPNGESRVTLNFNVTTGTGYHLGVGANANLYRNNSGPSYPYTLAGVFSITSSTAGNDYYYTCYDWEVEQGGCTTERIPVTAYLEALPILESMVDQAICPGEDVTLSASGTDIGSYSWAPGGAITSDVTVSPSTTTIYTVTGTNNCGSTTEDVEVTVYNAPSQPSINLIGTTLYTSGGFTYQWYLDGSPIQGATDSSYVAVETGDYTVEITDANGCTSVSEVLPVITIGVSKLVSEDIQIYPNPSKNIFNVVLPNTGEGVQVLVYNSIGELILSNQTSDNSLILNATNWANGIYSIQITGSNLSVTKKLIKTR